ncbi:MAG: hypothetical protein ACTSU7_01415 [Candidatus Heimdallarchaeaceae archaeon]
MIGTLKPKDVYYEIITEWSTKSYSQKNERIDELITEVISGDLPYDTLIEKKFEASTIAKMILRSTEKIE